MCGWVGECSTWNTPLLSLLFCGAVRCLLARLAVDPDGHGTVVRQRHLHVGAEATRTDGATESLLKGANDLAVEGLGELRAGADVVGVHSEFVRRLTDEVEEGCADPIIDLILLFVEQVFAGRPFLVGFLRLQRYGFLV